MVSVVPCISMRKANKTPAVVLGTEGEIGLAINIVFQFERNFRNVQEGLYGQQKKAEAFHQRLPAGIVIFLNDALLFSDALPCLGKKTFLNLISSPHLYTTKNTR